jgi:hypothetical protein
MNIVISMSLAAGDEGVTSQPFRNEQPYDAGNQTRPCLKGRRSGQCYSKADQRSGSSPRPRQG